MAVVLGYSTFVPAQKSCWQISGHLAAHVRIAERKDVVIREATSEADLDVYYELLQITSERDDFFIHTKDFIKRCAPVYWYG